MYGQLIACLPWICLSQLQNWEISSQIQGSKFCTHENPISGPDGGKWVAVVSIMLASPVICKSYLVSVKDLQGLQGQLYKTPKVCIFPHFFLCFFMCVLVLFLVGFFCLFFVCVYGFFVFVLVTLLPVLLLLFWFISFVVFVVFVLVCFLCCFCLVLFGCCCFLRLAISDYKPSGPCFLGTYFRMDGINHSSEQHFVK